MRRSVSSASELNCALKFALDKAFGTELHRFTCRTPVGSHEENTTLEKTWMVAMHDSFFFFWMAIGWRQHGLIQPNSSPLIICDQ